VFIHSFFVLLECCNYTCNTFCQHGTAGALGWAVLCLLLAPPAQVRQHLLVHAFTPLFRWTAATMLLLLLIPIQSSSIVGSIWVQSDGFLACRGKKGLRWISIVDLSSI
jgi:hypothetical protein